MVHILRNEQGEFYWLAVGKKANTFEELGTVTRFSGQIILWSDEINYDILY